VENRPALAVAREWKSSGADFAGQDAHDVGVAFDFLVEAFEQEGVCEVLEVFARQAVEGPRLIEAVA
jgi:hypothetical protein